MSWSDARAIVQPATADASLAAFKVLWLAEAAQAND